MKFKDKVVVITGASTGIGRSVALRIAKDRAKIVLVARSLDKLQLLQNEVSNCGSESTIYSLDLTKFNNIQNMFDDILLKYNRIDAVFNNAGIGFVKPIQNMTVEAIKSIIDLNVTSMILVSKYAVNVMTQQKFGHIIITSSIAGLITIPYWSVYVASKWAVTGFADSIRLEVSKNNVIVTTLHPGPVRTDFFNQEKANLDVDSLGSKVLNPEEVAEIVYKTFFTKKDKIIVPSNLKYYYYLKKFLPSIYDFFVNTLNNNIRYVK
ncbi:MAG: SDR family NAD(P)-dependent oxidoreductase [Candidatus Dojkabacteria bacterium]|nr:SDR family NAD(P)-dependent oxidoreductase [Candidatus Dojkabacteria bacterium]